MHASITSRLVYCNDPLPKKAIKGLQITQKAAAFSSSIVLLTKTRRRAHICVHLYCPEVPSLVVCQRLYINKVWFDLINIQSWHSLKSRTDLYLANRSVFIEGMFPPFVCLTAGGADQPGQRDKHLHHPERISGDGRVWAFHFLDSHSMYFSGPGPLTEMQSSTVYTAYP